MPHSRPLPTFSGCCVKGQCCAVGTVEAVNAITSDEGRPRRDLDRLSPLRRRVVTHEQAPTVGASTPVVIDEKSHLTLGQHRATLAGTPRLPATRALFVSCASRAKGAPRLPGLTRMASTN